MNPMSLFLLGRKLTQIAEGALPQGKMAKSGRLIYVDVEYHPNSSISEITERTSLPQSLVSTTVAQLRDLGLLATHPDAADRRRTLVRTTTKRRPVQRRLAGVSVDDDIARELSAEDQDELAEVHAALELLSRLLTPEVFSFEPVAS
jgi:DNA-binding MarR family transcriptional regulator